MQSSDTFLKNEEVTSNYGYLSGYKPKGVTEQTDRLRQLFPGIGYADEKLADGTLPPNAEGWFAIPRWENVASTYNEALEIVLDMVKQTRDGKFYNHRDGKIGPKYLRQTGHTLTLWNSIADSQRGYEILIVPAQFGLRHSGRSVRCAREAFAAGEFGLGAFAIGIMILTHPERLMGYDDLWIDCSGDEYDNPVSFVRFDYAPYFGFNGGQVVFGASWFGNASASYESASGFVPQI